MEKSANPRILLIGVGKFGNNHLRILQDLEKRNYLSLIGAVVSTKKSQKAVTETYKIPVFTKITSDLLKQVDGVDVVVPTNAHYSVVKKCLQYTNVLVEKPLASTYKQSNDLYRYAKKLGRILMVGHVYRFHPVINKVKYMLLRMRKYPQLVDGKLLDPIGTGSTDNIPLEFLHFFDILDYIFGKVPIIYSSQTSEQMATVHLKYPMGMNAIFQLGWSGDKKIRTLNFDFFGKKIMCDLANKTIEIHKRGHTKKIVCSAKPEPLELELSTFINVLKNKTKSYPDGKIGARIVGIVEKVKPIPRKKKPKVAIIGGGIFGATCAIELGKFCDVTLFERNQDLLLEASYVNQYRHHWGYHYPRSIETVRECQSALKDFETLYGKAIVRGFPAYHCVAKTKTKTSAKKYLEFCSANNLICPVEYPPKGFLNRNKVDICLKTAEPVYSYKQLRKIIKSCLLNNNIKIRFNLEVINGKLSKDFKKILIIKDENNNKRKGVFDYVINATYANFNRFAKWFNFPIKPLRIDIVELLVLRLPLPKIAMTIMDGPFATLVTTGDKNIFTLGHVKESMLKSVVPKDGLVPKWKMPQSKWKNILHQSKKWYPILKNAEYLQSRYVIRAINAYREYDDARPSDITSYGFGCWSILGGKVITCVSTAKTIANEIQKGQYQ